MLHISILLKLFTILNVFEYSFSQLQLDISMSTSTVNMISNYTFTITKSTSDVGDIIQNSIITIYFPNPYNLAFPSGNYTCLIQTWAVQLTVDSLNCTITGLKLSVTGGFPNDYIDVSSTQIDIFSFTIINLTNPNYSTITDIFYGFFMNPNGTTQLSFQTLNQMGVSITTGSLSCSLTANPTSVNTNSTMVITLTPTNPITTNGGIIFKTSSRFWPTDSLKLINSTIFTSLNATCTPYTNVASNILCNVSLLPDTTYSANITNVVTSNSTKTISFGIFSIVNPPSTQDQGNFTIITYNSKGYVDQCTGVKMTGITPGMIRVPVFSMSNTLINKLSNATLSFRITNFLALTDTIQVTFPTALILYIQAVTYGANQITYTSLGQIVTFSISQSIFPSNPIITIYFSQIQNPPSTLAITGFNISTLRNSNPIDTLSSSFSYTPTAGNLNINFTASILQMGANSNYTFQITLANPVKNTSSINITFPTSFTMASGAFNCISTKSAQVSCSYLNYILKIENYTTDDLPASTLLILTVLNITNPLLLGNFSSLNILTTYSNNNDVVDIITLNLTLTLVSRKLSYSSVSLISNNYTTYTNSMFTFTIQNGNPLPANSLIYINFPSQVTVLNQNCKINNLAISCPFVSYNNLQVLKIINNSTLSSTGLNSFPISVVNVITPISTQQTDSFQIFLIYPDGTLSQYLSTGLYFQASTARQFKTFSISTNNSQNSALTTYTFSFTPYFILPNLTVGKIVFPLIMSPTNQCVNLAATSVSISCDCSNNIVSLSFNFTSNTNIPVIIFSIGGIKNYPMQQISYMISITLYTQNTLFLYSTQSASLINNMANEIKIENFSFSNRQLYATSSLTLNFTPTTLIPASGKLVIIFPPQFSLNLNCSTITDFICSNSGNIINLIATNPISSNTLITITNFTNPTNSPSSFISIRSYSTVSDLLYVMDESINIVFFSTFCNLYCRNCLTTNISFCLNCYANSSLVSGNIYMNTDNTCNSKCSYNSFLNTTSNICILCSTSCLTCLDDINNCTSCPVSQFLSKNSCVITCSYGFFGDTILNICSLCISFGYNCLTCKNATYCLTCQSNFYLYSSSCLQNCPSLSTYLNTTNSTCIECTSLSNCLYCTGFPPTCTKCLTGYLFDSQSSICSLVCLGVKVSNGTNCVYCNNPCLTCAGGPDSCTSCNVSSTNKYFYNQYCLNNCPSGYYNDDASNFICSICTVPCSSCTNSSIISCTSCISGYYYVNTANSCVTDCPNGSYKNNNNCSLCNTSCLTCSHFNVCTACIPGLYILYNVCYNSCPANMITGGNACLNCSINCYSCANLNSSQCTTCYTGFYILSGICYANCPTGYFNPTNASVVCASCNSICTTCLSDTICTNCTIGLVLSSNVCVGNCTNNQIPINNVCTSCATGCATCIDKITSCSSCKTGFLYNIKLYTCSIICSTGYYNYNNLTCQSTCPDGFYNSTSTCLSCDLNCATCLSLIICTSCNSSLFLYNSMCYSSCPSSAPYLNGNMCFTCNVINCQQCTGTVCSSCSKGLLLIKYELCITGCETNHTYNPLTLTCDFNSSAVSSVLSSSTSMSFVPVPYLIFCIIFAGTILLSKLHHDKVNFINALLPIISISEILVCFTNFIIFEYNANSFSFNNFLLALNARWSLLILGFLIIFCLNITNLLLMYFYLKQDDIFIKFYQKNKIGFIIIYILSAFTNFKLVEIFYSFYFSFSIFSLTLSKIQYPKKYQILQWISLLPILLIITSGGFAIIQQLKVSYLFFGGIQNIVLGVFQLGLTIASLRLPKQYIVRYSQTQSFGMEAAAAQEVESHTQLDNSEHNIIHSKQQQLQNKSDVKQSHFPNIQQFDEKGNLKQSKTESSDLMIRRAESTQIIPQKVIMMDEFEYKSAFDYHKDVMVVNKEKIPQALDQGVFRHNLKSIIQHQRKQQQEDALSDAIKLNEFQKKKRQMKQKPIIEQPQQYEQQTQNGKKLDPQKNIAKNHLNNQQQQLKQNQQIFFQEELISVQTHLNQQQNQGKRLTTLGSLEPGNQDFLNKGSPTIQKKSPELKNKKQKQQFIQNESNIQKYSPKLKKQDLNEKQLQKKINLDQKKLITRLQQKKNNAKPIFIDTNPEKLYNNNRKSQFQKRSPDRIFKLPQIDLGSPSVTNRNVLPSILNSSKSPSQIARHQQHNLKSQLLSPIKAKKETSINIKLLPYQGSNIDAYKKINQNTEKKSEEEVIFKQKYKKKQKNALQIDDIDFFNETEKIKSPKKKIKNMVSKQEDQLIEEHDFKQLQMQSKNNKKQDDLQSIFTVQDNKEQKNLNGQQNKKYQGSFRTIQFNSRYYNNNNTVSNINKQTRYKKQQRRMLQDEGFDDLKKPSQMFNRLKQSTFMNYQNTGQKKGDSLQGSNEGKSVDGSRGMFNRVGKMLLNNSFDKT